MRSLKTVAKLRVVAAVVVVGRCWKMVGFVVVGVMLKSRETVQRL
jgi:hypothetical protein